MPNPNKLPDINNLEDTYGFITAPAKSFGLSKDLTYVLLNLPQKIEGPAFERFQSAPGEHCVGAYCVQVKDTPDKRNIPTNDVRLAVWPSRKAFYDGAVPRAFFLVNNPVQTPRTMAAV